MSHQVIPTVGYTCVHWRLEEELKEEKDRIEMLNFIHAEADFSNQFFFCWFKVEDMVVLLYDHTRQHLIINAFYLNCIEQQ